MKRYTLALLLFATLCMGCSSMKKVAGLFHSSEMTLSVTTTAQTNRGTPLYAVVCEVDDTQFLTEDYDAIAAKAFASQPEASTLARQVLFPDKEDQEIIVPLPQEGKSLAIYFLFTEPGERWKMIFRPPVSSSVSLDLGDNQINTPS